MAYSAVDMMQTTRECLVLDVAKCFKGYDVVEVLGYRHAYYNNLCCHTRPSLILLRIFGLICEATIGQTEFMLIMTHFVMLQSTPGTTRFSIQRSFNRFAGLPMPSALINRNWYKWFFRKENAYALDGDLCYGRTDQIYNGFRCPRSQ